jgi:hypothetical protein
MGRAYRPRGKLHQTLGRVSKAAEIPKLIIGTLRALSCRKLEVRSLGSPPGTQPPCMQSFLLPDGANFRERCRPECADLWRSSGLSFGQEVDEPAFAHIALHA